MQDKFAIGPVTFVQLVGLEAKPRIPSARADGAARAADHPPPSAAPGLGGPAQEPVLEIEPSYIAMKASSSLGLTADPLRAHITVEAGIDRPDPNANPSPPKEDPLPPEDNPAHPDAPNGSDDGRGGDIPTDPDLKAKDDGPFQSLPAEPTDDDGKVTPSETLASTAVSDAGKDFGSDVIFDGEAAFGDDEILDFTLAISEAYLAENADESSIGKIAAFDLQLHAIDDLDLFGSIDFAGTVSQEPDYTGFDPLVVPQYPASGSDAVPLI